MKDILIIGAGPAGITSAVYAARKGLSLCIVSKDIGGQAAWSSNIENYTGYQFITGPDLVQKFRNHLEQYKFDILEGMEVVKVEKKEKGFKALLSNGEIIEAKTIIVASGKKPKTLNVPRENEFTGKGVAYCTTCDAPVFAGKNTAVVGGGNSALDAAISLAKISPKVYIINIADKLTGDTVMIEKIKQFSNVEILNDAKTIEIFGDKFVEGMKVLAYGGERLLSVEGIFVEIGLMPNSDFIDCVEKNDIGEINVNCGSATSCPGIFAAGDVTSIPDKQIIIAAGEGSKAALAAYRYLTIKRE
ncbi:thioredoxin-disulfide reductase [candidate division WOR-1 bacterium RIFOXYA2_FULL_36_21]|uniref:Thioredoxin-disulfide reductase n=1 Tax=candidate division WOR-1 bacterium RIFOXYB2_FULL_36_35 TaxID=1802578 RepID=A0A1F4S632_UNCSA|nr:MAG: thioredoxin-disulfide reductase [candidate division WOR-1 bacterium RIFOXYA2_FULL_36_21]OGC15870.1 MAG: thioredoxin-disulfide reductase [candidate division WOR-1 bacterium RIFOXYB2_FULL_36_35]